jgi:hypothetical protein
MTAAAALCVVEHRTLVIRLSQRSAPPNNGQVGDPIAA